MRLPRAVVLLAFLALNTFVAACGHLPPPPEQAEWKAELEVVEYPNCERSS